MSKLKAVVIGAGYFGKFHYAAWNRIPEVEVVAMSDLDEHKCVKFTQSFNIPKYYVDYREMLEKEKPDFVDIVTPPNTHFEICKAAADLGVNIICQKPLAPTFEEAEKLVAYCHKSDIRFMVHENFRFQPWHREIKKLLENDEIGEKLFYLNFRMRMGDGWQNDAYIARQPYFRTMPQLLIFETGVHIIDTFRFLAGEIKSVYARLKKLNKDIAGEDAGIIFFDFENGTQGIFDGNRYNESNHPNPRYTFGECLLEGEKGSIRLYLDGKITIQKLGANEREHQYQHENIDFSGDCVFNTQKHFVEALLNNKEFETSVEDYLKTLNVQDAVYASNLKKKIIDVEY
ncbi:MAG: Gfo/Idh/MocA family oxidoreductase [Flammeovirgaceae bacterium]|nr:Gfo/Idh/MocA family oxidoreductase [Flammeovirgaceae bacterium]